MAASACAAVYFSEAFHNLLSLNEAQAKFVRPAISGQTNHTLRVLDVCFGLGYNSAALWESLNEQTSNAVVGARN